MNQKLSETNLVRRELEQTALYLDQPSSKEKTYLPVIFTQVSLPRSGIKEREYKCENGDAWIFIQAGSLDMGNGPVEQKLPYGALPRLILCHITTQVLQKDTGVVDLEESAAKFLKKIGLDSQGARHVMLKQQICSLAACRFQMGYQGKTYNGNPIRQFELFRSETQTNKSSWPKQIILSDDFFMSIKESSVPLDLRAIKQLKGSSLALDIYVWLAHRLYRIKKPTLLYWILLRRQFSPECVGPNANKNFKKTFMIALDKVLKVYPAAKVKKVPGGVLLKKSYPPVLPKN